MSTVSLTQEELFQHVASHGSVRPAAQAVPGGLTSRSFMGLLVTQFLGALNDNMFRWLVVPIGKYLVGDAHEAIALSAGLACFVLPYVLFAAPAGWLADRFSKRDVIIGCKVAEVIIMLLGVAAILLGNLYILFLVVFLMGSQSALFGPSKYGSLPEMLKKEKLSAANGVIGMTTILAVVAGSMAGNYLYSLTGPDGTNQLWLSAVALLGVGMLGLMASFLVGRLRPADAGQPFPWRMAQKSARDLKALAGDQSLMKVALAIAFFWGLAALAQMNIDLFGTRQLGLDQKQIGLLLAAMALGVGLGHCLAGIWSDGRIELGMVPVGAAGIALAATVLFVVAHSLPIACACLFLLGGFGGLFDVPLQSYLQDRSPARSRGAVMAASNQLTFAATLGVAAVFYLLSDRLGLSARAIFLVCGLATLAVAAYSLRCLPAATIRFLVHLASRTVYRVRIEGLENLPVKGGVLLAPNHVSWLDGVFLILMIPRPVRMIGYADYFSGPLFGRLARLFGVIPIKPEAGRKSVGRTILAARQALRRGEVVCIFPEGKITRDGRLQPFRPGLMSMVAETGAEVIPVYLNGLWGSIFSYCGGTSFLKRPRQWPYPVSIHVGKPLDDPQSADEVRIAVQRLGVQTVSKRNKVQTILPKAFLRTCRRSMSRRKIADTTGTVMTGAQLLLRTLIFRRLLEREVLGRDEPYVGLLVPPSAGAVLANAALPLCGRIAVNLNYTCSSDVINACIRQCNIRHVLTSRRVMQRLKLDIDAELIYLEDLVGKVRLTDKLFAAMQTYLWPLWLLDRYLGLNKIKEDDTLTVLFTSGSTGDPKGVMLSHKNVSSNVQAIEQIVHLRDDDVAVGVLPFFHSYGYTATLWTVLALDPMGVYHISPLEGKQVGELVRQYGGTIFMATPTFLRTYLKRCQPEDFATLDVVFASAEKLPKALSDAFEQRFGVRPCEAYGATEMSPLISLNVPPSRESGVERQGAKEGTVGRPIPGTQAKVIHPETGEDLGVDQPGMLLVRGPNVMKGYLNHPELTAEKIRDGWYVTGDIAFIDAGGFLHITGRESRFSKIGGEMVPHIKIEETINRLLSTGVDDDTLRAVVTAIPDEKKGEKLVVLHVALDKPEGQIRRELAESGLPNLWIPAADAFCEVEEIPVLGTGKLDLRALKDLAMEKFGITAGLR